MLVHLKCPQCPLSAFTHQALHPTHAAPTIPVPLVLFVRELLLLLVVVVVISIFYSAKEFVLYRLQAL